MQIFLSYRNITTCSRPGRLQPRSDWPGSRSPLRVRPKTQETLCTVIFRNITTPPLIHFDFLSSLLVTYSSILREAASSSLFSSSFFLSFSLLHSSLLLSHRRHSTTPLALDGGRLCALNMITPHWLQTVFLAAFLAGQGLVSGLNIDLNDEGESQSCR